MLKCKQLGCKPADQPISAPYLNLDKNRAKKRTWNDLTIHRTHFVLKCLAKQYDHKKGQSMSF